MSAERADALLVAARSCRMAVGRINAVDVQVILAEAGAPDVRVGEHSLADVLRAWGESQLIGLAEVFEELAQLDDARWRNVRGKLDSADGVRG